MSHNQLMYHLRNMPVYALWLVLGIIAVALTVTLFVWVLGMIVLVLVIGLAWWAVGMPITIKQDDKVVGRLKWFTYTPEVSQ